MMMQIILTYCIVTQFIPQCLLRSNFIYLTFLSFTENIFHSANLIVLNFEMCQITPVPLLCFCLNLTLQAKKCTYIIPDEKFYIIQIYLYIESSGEEVINNSKKMKMIILKDEAMKRTGLLWCFFLRKCLDDDEVFKQLVQYKQCRLNYYINGSKFFFYTIYMQKNARRISFKNNTNEHSLNFAVLNIYWWDDMRVRVWPNSFQTFLFLKKPVFIFSLTFDLRSRWLVLSKQF